LLCYWLTPTPIVPRMFSCIASDANAIWHCLSVVKHRGPRDFCSTLYNRISPHRRWLGVNLWNDDFFNQFSTRVIILEKISISSRRYFGHVVTSHPYCDPNRKDVAHIGHTKRRNSSCLAALGRNWPCTGQYLSGGLLELLTVDVVLWKIMTAWKRGLLQIDAPFGNSKRGCKDQYRSSCN